MEFRTFAFFVLCAGFSSFQCQRAQPYQKSSAYNGFVNGYNQYQPNPGSFNHVGNPGIGRGVNWYQPAPATSQPPPFSWIGIPRYYYPVFVTPKRGESYIHQAYSPYGPSNFGGFGSGTGPVSFSPSKAEQPTGPFNSGNAVAPGLDCPPGEVKHKQLPGVCVKPKRGVRPHITSSLSCPPGEIPHRRLPDICIKPNDS